MMKYILSQKERKYNMEKIVITMPIAPYSDFSVGKMSTPILAEMLAKKMKAKFVLSVNMLDSYKKRNIEQYQKLLDEYNIRPDYYWVDSAHVDELLQKIYYLISKKYIYEKQKKILTCDCKKVELSEENLKTINMKDSCFEIINDKYYCKSCGGECKFELRECLVFNPNLIENKNFIFFPKFINKDIKTFLETVGKNEIIVTRTRQTGINILYYDKKYNLDIDFLWGVYLSLFSNYDKIVLCSNHQLYQLYMVTMLEKCFEPNSKTISLATPHLNVTDKKIEEELKNRLISLKLFIVLNQKWSKKENTFDVSLLKYINSMNVEKKKMLNDIIIESENVDDFENELYSILMKKFNIQNANKELKRRRKNV